MLRRPATTLQITSEDLAAYESRRVREAHAAQRALREQQQQAEAESHQEQQTPGDEKEERIRRRRDERIGVGRR